MSQIKHATGSVIAGNSITRPVLKNFTIFGYSTSGSEVSELENGVHFRRASGINLQNSIIAGYNNAVRFENITSAGSTFSYNIVQALSTLYNPATGGTPAVFKNNQTRIITPANNFLFLLGGSNAFYANGNYEVLNITPDTTSPATTGGVSGTYNGAFDPNAATFWTENWTKFNF